MRRPAVPVVLLVLVAAWCGDAPAAVVLQRVAIIDFYAPTPLGGSGGVVPERYAADALARRLAQAAADRFTVVSRASVEQAAASLRWRDVDVLDFERLREVGRATGATMLVIGWIPLFVVSTGGGGSVPPIDGDLPAADVNLVVQLFDVEQGRLTAETRQRASVAAGMPRDLLIESVLEDAVSHAVGPVVARLLLPP